jgi:hypothetical protein
MERVYEYTDDDGNVYWSTYKAPHLITVPLRLKLRNRVGRNWIQFLHYLRSWFLA